MPANPFVISTVKDLDGAGLLDFPLYGDDHRLLPHARMATLAALSSLAKYYVPSDPWCRWIGVDALSDLSQNGGASRGYSFSGKLGVISPYILLNQSLPEPGKSVHDAKVDAILIGAIPPSFRPSAHEPVFEAMRRITDYALSVGLIADELSHRVSGVLQHPWHPRDAFTPTIKEQISVGLSALAATSTRAFITEALVEWNEHGYGSGALAIAVGSTIDRYLTRSAGAYEVLAGVTQRIDELMGMPPEEARRKSVGALQPTQAESKLWETASVEYWRSVATDSTAVVPFPASALMTLERKVRPFELVIPTNRAPVVSPVLDDMEILEEVLREEHNMSFSRAHGINRIWETPQTPVTTPGNATTRTLLTARNAAALSVGVSTPDSWPLSISAAKAGLSQ